MANRRNVRIVAVFALLFAAGPLSAQEKDSEQKDDAQAQQSANLDRTKEAATRFERGVQFFKDSNYAAALAEFESAYQIKPNYAVLWNIAAAQKNLFRYSDALKTLERYLSEGGAAVSKQKRSAAEREQAAIRALMAEVVITGPPGTTIFVDDKDEGKLPLEGSVWLGPGDHVVRGVADGFKTSEVKVKVVSGDKKEIVIELDALPKTPTTSKLTVTSLPSKATVEIDRKRVGLTPWSGTLKPGGYRVRASLKGFDAQELEIALLPGQERPVRFDLKKTVESKPFFKRWYVWVGIGVLAAAGGATAYVLTREEPDVIINFP